MTGEKFTNGGARISARLETAQALAEKAGEAPNFYRDRALASIALSLSVLADLACLAVSSAPQPLYPQWIIKRASEITQEALPVEPPVGGITGEEK